MKVCLFVSTEYTNVTDGRTPRDGIGRAYACHYHLAAITNIKQATKNNTWAALVGMK